MQKYKTRYISVGGKRFRAIIADSTIKRMIGLMFRKGIEDNSCMLFIFGSEDFHAIWMYNMLFSIDVAWADAKGRIIDSVQSLKPCNSMLGCKEFVPKEKARYVLEFNHGAIKRAKIKNGSLIKLGKAISSGYK